MRLILASSSPRRQELLARLVNSFEVIPSHIEEIFNPELQEIDVKVADLARQKAAAILQTQALDSEQACLVLGADTVVYLDGEILGKPQDEAEAERMLTALSGRQHQVLTGLALVSQANGQMQVWTGCVCSQVQMRSIDADERAAYIATGEPLDKAGAYGIQGRAQAFVTGIEGSYENIVGLPLEATRELLLQAGFPNLNLK